MKVSAKGICRMIIGILFALHFSSAFGFKPNDDVEKWRKAIESINSGWGMFIGEDGYVDEVEAVKRTFSGYKALLKLKERDAEAISVALNNISVFLQCAYDPSIKNIDLALGLKQKYEDSYSRKNLFWEVFLRRRDDFSIVDLRNMAKGENASHPVMNYLADLNWQLPATSDMAYQFVRIKALMGDAAAAERMAYFYECSAKLVDVDSALSWYRAADMFYAKNKDFESALSVLDRIKRLELLKPTLGYRSLKNKAPRFMAL